MTDLREQELDERLRAALEPEAGQARRVAGAALEPRSTALDRLLHRIFGWEPSFARRHPLRSLTGLSLLIVLGGWLAVFAVWLVLELSPERPLPPSEAAARYSLTNRNGVVVVRRPDGGAAFLHSGAPADDPPRGMILIVQGDHRP